MDSSRPAQEVVIMHSAFVVQWFLDIPELSGTISHDELGQKVVKEPELPWRLQHQRAVDRFRWLVTRKYNTGTLERLLNSEHFRVRQSSAFALGLVGPQTCTPALWRMLGDSSREVRQTVQESLWNLWFRGSTEAHNQELRRIIRMRDKNKALFSINALLRKAPKFAEAFNQRAILNLRLQRPL
jgi:hypothetical protein